MKAVHNCTGPVLRRVEGEESLINCEQLSFRLSPMLVSVIQDFNKGAAMNLKASAGMIILCAGLALNVFSDPGDTPAIGRAFACSERHRTCQSRTENDHARTCFQVHRCPFVEILNHADQHRG